MNIKNVAIALITMAFAFAPAAYAERPSIHVSFDSSGDGEDYQDLGKGPKEVSFDIRAGKLFKVVGQWEKQVWESPENITNAVISSASSGSVDLDEFELPGEVKNYNYTGKTSYVVKLGGGGQIKVPPYAVVTLKFKRNGSIKQIVIEDGADPDDETLGDPDPEGHDARIYKPSKTLKSVLAE